MKTPFYMLVFKAFHAQRQKNRMNMNAFRLSPGQPKVLRYIQNHKDCKLKDIAKECDIESATVSKILDNLEEKKALEKWDEHCLEIEQISLKGFSEKEKQQFQEYLSRMYTNLTGKEIL